MSNVNEIDEDPDGNSEAEDEETNKVERRPTIDGKSMETRVHDWTSLVRRVRRH